MRTQRSAPPVPRPMRPPVPPSASLLVEVVRSTSHPACVFAATAFRQSRQRSRLLGNHSERETDREKQIHSPKIPQRAKLCAERERKREREREKSEREKERQQLKGNCWQRPSSERAQDLLSLKFLCSLGGLALVLLLLGLSEDKHKRPKKKQKTHARVKKQIPQKVWEPNMVSCERKKKAGIIVACSRGVL